jgi:ABC-type multidrug transport system fused ATPase/permease subunit
MGFVFDGLEAEAYDRSYSDRQLAARIIGYFRPELGQMLLVALMIVLASLANTAFPIFIAQGVGAAQGGIPPQTVALIVAALLLSGALAWGFNFVRQWYTARAVGDVVLRLRQDSFDAVLARDLSFYDEFPSGKIVSRVTSDTETSRPS